MEVFLGFVLFFFVFFFVLGGGCFFFGLLCLSSSYVLCAQYRQCLSLYYPFLIVPSVFSNVYSIYIYLFIIRDSKVVIVIIATFVQPGNRRRV